MEIIVALGIGLLTAAGLYLLLRPHSFSVVLGLTLLSYAVNALILVSGRIGDFVPPLAGDAPDASRLADPLPQALVLTAIVIGFGMTAYLLAAALKAKAASGTSHVDAREDR
jgi:multicomponent K+:H+ antiporter subunit C